MLKQAVHRCCVFLGEAQVHHTELKQAAQAAQSASRHGEIPLGSAKVGLQQQVRSCVLHMAVIKVECTAWAVQQLCLGGAAT
jgi:hypothetical protein